MGATFGSTIMLVVLNHQMVEGAEGLAHEVRVGSAKIRHAGRGFKFPCKSLISMVGAQGLEPWTR